MCQKKKKKKLSAQLINDKFHCLNGKCEVNNNGIDLFMLIPNHNLTQ